MDNKLSAQHKRLILWKICVLYFFTFGSLHTLDLFILKAFESMSDKNFNKAIIVNYMTVFKAIAGMLMSFLTVKIKNHKLMLILIYFSFMIGLILFVIVTRMKEMTLFKYILIVLGVVLYKSGYGSVLALLEFIKMNNVSKINSLHAITIISIACTLGSGFGHLPSTILPFFIKDDYWCIFYYEVLGAINTTICIVLCFVFCPEYDYSSNFDHRSSSQKSNKNEKTDSLGFFQSLLELLKLHLTKFFIFILCVLSFETLVGSIKLIISYLNQYITKNNAMTSIMQQVRLIFQIILFVFLIPLKKEKYIYIYCIVACVCCGLRPLVFKLAMRKQGGVIFLLTLNAFFMALETGFQHLSLTRICNQLTPARIKTYSYGYYISLKNGAAPLLANMVCHIANKGQTKIQPDTLQRVLSTTIILGILTLSASFVLFFTSYKKMKQ